MDAFLESWSLFLFTLEFHALHAMELEFLGISFCGCESNAVVMVPLSTNFALEHVHFILVWFSTNTKDSSFWKLKIYLPSSMRVSTCYLTFLHLAFFLDFWTAFNCLADPASEPPFKNVYILSLRKTFSFIIRSYLLQFSYAFSPFWIVCQKSSYLLRHFLISLLLGWLTSRILRPVSVFTTVTEIFLTFESFMMISLIKSSSVCWITSGLFSSSSSFS